MRYGTVTSWDPSIATGNIEEDGMSEHNVFPFHDSREFSAGDRVVFEVVDGVATDVDFLEVNK